MAASYDVASLLAELRIQEHFTNNTELYVDKTLDCYEKASLQRLSTLGTVTGYNSQSEFRLLDVGCGGGFFIDLFLKNFVKATACGVDFCRAMLETNTFSPRKTLKQGNALALPEKCGDFEVINVDTVLHHLVSGRSYGRTVAQITECLKHLQSRLMPGGVLCVREIYHEFFGCETLGTRIIFFLSTLSLPKFLERLLKFAGIKTANAGVCFLSRKQWGEIFHDAGLSMLSVEENAWSSQPYRRFGFKVSGDIYYILSPKRPYV